MNTNRIISGGKSLLPALLVAGQIFTACNKDNGNTTVPVSGTFMVTAAVADYMGTEDGESSGAEIINMQACVFDGGRMIHVYENLNAEHGNIYELSVDSRKGTLYMVANSDGMLDLEGLQAQGISEEEWLRTVIPAKDGMPVHFLSGSMALEGSGPVVPLTLKRGVARFDLKVRTAGVAEINSFTLKNAASSAYLFSLQDDDSPAGHPSSDLVAAFDSPLVGDTAGVLHVYEQLSNKVSVSVDAVIDGKPVILEKEIAEPLKRNTVYTVTVRKNEIDISLDVTLEDWQQGGDTELVP